MLPSHSLSEELLSLRRQVRLLMLLDAAERAGIAPLRLRVLHTYAYLSNVLAPVWRQRIFESYLLKSAEGPFYPGLQRDLDRLVGRGLAVIHELSFARDENDQWRMDATFSLNRELAYAALRGMAEYSNYQRVHSFVQEVAYALSALDDRELEDLTSQDPTYSDDAIGDGNVIEFGNWNDKNFSANSALHFANLYGATRGELLHLYVRHLRRRLHGDF